MSGSYARAVLTQDDVWEILERGLQKPVESTKPQGSGLGLTICRHVAHAHGAELKPTARPGGGTIFSLVFSGS